MPSIQDARILIVATDGFEQSELLVPQEKLSDAGAKVHVAAPASRMKKGKIYGWDESDWGKTVTVDKDLDEVEPRRYDALVLPGGQINPDKLRLEPKALEIVRAFLAAGKPVAAICHGPWLLVEVGALKGRRATSFKSIRTDLVNAGAEWVDQEVVVDRGVITSRSPADLDAFVGAIVEAVERAERVKPQAAE